jgi:hypothetical protein
LLAVFSCWALDGCARKPVHAPGAAAESLSGDANEEAVVAAASKECVARELVGCTNACQELDCMTWCAGDACAALASELGECVAAFDDDFEREHPEPSMPIEEASNEDATEAAIVDYAEWSMLREDAIAQHWPEHCAPVCARRSDGFADRPPCSESSAIEIYKYKSLARRSKGTGSFNDLSVGPMRLASAFATLDLRRPSDANDSRVATLRKLIQGQHLEHSGLARCFGDAKDEQVLLALRFEADGAVATAGVVEGNESFAACVATAARNGIRLPSRVALQYPDVHVAVRAPLQRPPFDEALRGLPSNDALWRGLDSGASEAPRSGAGQGHGELGGPGTSKTPPEPKRRPEAGRGI